MDGYDERGGLNRWAEWAEWVGDGMECVFGV
jgi:hypothetical protein